jgi:anti-sigma regulatory factor (Ser/Thr protein kinase)
MTGNITDRVRDRLDLRSRLSDIARIPHWVEQLAVRYSFSKDLLFAIDLCLEEAIANTIIYGYRGEGDRPINVSLAIPRDGDYVFSVEDEAPPFNPLDAPELPPLNPDDEIRVGGQGLRLLRRFAGSLEYEPTASGNRLRIGFSTNA